MTPVSVGFALVFSLLTTHEAVSVVREANSRLCKVKTAFDSALNKLIESNRHMEGHLLPLP